jgi:hypothetical protein
MGSGLDSTGSGQGPVAGSREHGNDPTVTKKEGIFLTGRPIKWLLEDSTEFIKYLSASVHKR